MSGIDDELIALLACPRCKGRLERGAGDVLACGVCALAFPVRDGLPVLLLEESRPIDAE